MSLVTYFKTLLDKTDIILTDQQIQQLIAYIELLNKWNKAYNLTSIRSPEQMIIRHILDSIIVDKYLVGKRFIDVGTGPGLPGIPLAIVRPNAHFTLLDSLGKRVRFLRQIQHELMLKNIEPIQKRVEQYQPVEKFDGIISRAFASIQDMLSWCQHLPKQNGGQFYALKGTLSASEISTFPANFKLNKIISLDVPGLHEQRHLVILGFN
ncbi:16S rRNA (guanine(527)-N(7))-methyltransferase RsmG [Arsenophonus sp. aPb]|uniref:16S rRNA (guanine(527)-N(7))-methyltransferase RsmG n=1 Tax=Arsenophonus sp. aPb TaxID=3041619 RepID=UPI00246993E2|nr:16S rRNA (guanine(527)-N(7))-methyltransferase RsmG [Arsenophonus sp. aPb]WGL98360.1 16S rRNA (guanine(527)-N(7))-methyltransferase RsmG [Arsenophonus sp. aPb]